MFAPGDDVQVFFIHPGHHEPLWHRGKIVEKVKDSANYTVNVGGIVTQATPANIRKV